MFDQKNNVTRLEAVTRYTKGGRYTMGVAAAQTVVGKKEIAEHLRWSRPRLDRELERNPHFPVVSRGDQSGGWKFDKAAIDRYLTGAPAKAAKPPAIDKAQLRDVVAQPLPQVEAHTPKPAPSSAPRRSAHHAGEASAKQRKDDADASLKEDKLRELRGELVERGDLRQKLSMLMVGIAHDLDALPEKIVKECGLPEDAAPGIRTMIDQIRVEMVKRAEPMFIETP